ncbi:hypothetical protein Poli38472_011746 [Pythium oligandrum]|uniref:Uncharacterized protein n=1 Tax=Pythium oligandrum TaxID=41045 RepID=A0A8K1C841_PYTOL|nr:hypothetical protein Poli38472_011746 [Pythium oligandrum]|eukprot:TMW58158.1 hypothetical protein Poli38472_011746 [Pythium oligandrum]
MQSTPARDASRGRSLCVVGKRLARGWDRFLVELNGRFSIQRIENMREYCRQTSLLRVLLVWLSTPVPALLVIILFDCIPLASPNAGTLENYVFWIRLIPIVFILVSGPVEHFRCCLPTLPMTNFQLVLVGLAGSVPGVALGFAVSFLIGFPVPFNFVIESIAIFPAMVLALRMLWRQTLRESAALQADLRRQIFVLFGQASITYIYPLYFFAFVSMPPMAQSAFTLLLPLIKLGIKNYFSSTLQQLDDLKPAFVVFNVDVFSALYVANCLQASQSRLNTVLVCLMDITQLAVSFYDLRVVMTEIRSLVRVHQFDGSLLDLCAIASKSTGVREELDRRNSSLRTVSGKNVRGSRIVVPSSANAATSPSVVAINEALVAAGLDPNDVVQLVHKTAKILYMIEFLLLIEFAEVMIPVIYCIYMVAMSHLPNREFYPQLAALTSTELLHSITTVTLNAGLEFMSFIFVIWLVPREFKLSGPRLLAFALESHKSLVHSSLVIWTLYVILQPLTHSGVDFSLRFAWLRSKTGG